MFKKAFLTAISYTPGGHIWADQFVYRYFVEGCPGNITLKFDENWSSGIGGLVIQTNCIRRTRTISSDHCLYSTNVHNCFCPIQM